MLLGQLPPATSLTLKIDTGVVVPGTNAIFCNPVIPGPEMKKANASLKVHTNADVYSSELN